MLQSVEASDSSFGLRHVRACIDPVFLNHVCLLHCAADFQFWLFLRDPQMPLAAHEARKCRNILVYAAARMIMCTGVDLTLGPLSSAPVGASTGS